jgi:hypothetical protein
MRKVFLMAAALCLFSAAAYSQKATNYSGTWTLDVAKSTLDARMRIESMTMTVEQTAGELKVSTVTKRQAPPADASRPAPPAGRSGPGEVTTTYDLSGRETKIEVDGPNGKTPQMLKAISETGKLTLSKVQNFSTPMGEMTQTTKEVWQLSPDGKTLTVNREQSSQRGSNSATMVFTKS